MVGVGSAIRFVVVGFVVVGFVVMEAIMGGIT